MVSTKPEPTSNQPPVTVALLIPRAGFIGS
jgi:hypothetical protein